MFQRSFVPVLCDLELVLAIVDSSKIIGSSGKTRIERKCMLVSLASFVQGEKMVVRHADVVPDNRGFQIALLVGFDRGSVLPPRHQNIGLLLGRKLLEGESFTLRDRRFWGRAGCGLGCLACEYRISGCRKDCYGEPEFHAEERPTGNLTHDSPPWHAHLRLRRCNPSLLSPYEWAAAISNFE